MKYLYLHVILKAVIVLIITIISVFWYIIRNFFTFIWAFKILRWRDVFKEIDHYDYGDHIAYQDNTPIDTFLRIFKD